MQTEFTDRKTVPITTLQTVPITPLQTVSFNALQTVPLHRYLHDYIYEAFNGHTWYIQVLLNRLYGYTEPIDVQLVNYAIEEVIAESTYTYENLLAAYTTTSVKLLKAVAKAKCIKEINSGEFITEYKLKAASSVNSALKKLINNELIYKSTKGYIVYDRFMATWLSRLPF